MSVRDLPGLGSFLLGQDVEEHPGWLQAVHTSTSPLGDFIALGLEQRLVLLSARYTGSRRQMVPVFQGSLHGCVGEDQLTALLVLPVISAKGSQSAWHATVAGFSNGQVRVYTEAGQLLIQKAFTESTVKRLKVQAMAEGKHYTNVLHSQSVQELLVIHPSLVVTVSGSDLYQSLTENLTCLAMATAEEGEVEQGRLANLPGLRLIVKEQKIEDCSSLVAQHTSYSQYQDLTMQGGYVDERHKPVHTSPSFITTGLAPFLVYNDRTSSTGGPAALAHSVVSTVKSGLFRVATGAIGGLWGGGQTTEAGPRPDPESYLGVKHAIKDEGRQGLEILLSPNKLYSAVRDAQNRVMVVENVSGVVVQAWRGYHRVQMAWTVTTQSKTGEEEMTSDLQLAVLLLLYLPRRGLIEVWSPEQKCKVTEFHVSKHGLLLRSSLACLDDGIPRRREAIALYSCFLPPSGVLQHFYLPFHALSTTSSAERDLQMQAELTDLAVADPQQTDRLAELLLEVRNPQLRSQSVWDLVAGEQKILSSLVPDLLVRIRNTFQASEENVSIENKLWRSKVNKLFKLSLFYQELFKSSSPTDEEEGGEEACDEDVSPEEILSHCLVTDLEEITTLLEIAPVTLPAEKGSRLELADFLGCFETEGDLNNWKVEDQVRIQLRRNVSPRLALDVYCAVSRLCSHDIALAQDQFQAAGLNPEQFLHLVMAANLHSTDCSIPAIKRLFHTMNFLLNLNANVDDRHRASCQQEVAKSLKRAPMSPSVFVLGTVWKCALNAQSNLSLAMWAEEWSRKLNLVRAFLTVRTTLMELDPALNPSHSLSSVFEAGNGRMAELLARWVTQLGADARSLVQDMESLDTNPVQTLVSRCAQFFPNSSSLPVLLVHVCWEQLQTWTRDRDNLPSVIPSLLPGLWAIHCPVLRAHFLALLWRTFMDKLLQETARLTEAMAKTVVNRSAKCMEVCQFSAENAGAVLGLMASLLDCQLQTLALLGEHPTLPVQYDELCKDSRPHLLEHVQATKIPDIELVSLQHQLATVLELSWTLKVDLRPLHIFNSMEAGQLLQTQPGMFSSLFVDHNASVNRARVSWVEVVVEAAVGHIHLRPGEGRVYDTESFQQFCSKLYQVSKVWFLSDLVRTCQVEYLYRAGYDDLGLELRGGVTDVQRLAGRLLEVGLLRLAKHIWTGESQGRLAAVPPALLSHLAERKEASGSVAEAGLVDTVALLAWTANTLEDEDRHNLATSALAAGQVLTVRNNRNS